MDFSLLNGFDYFVLSIIVLSSLIALTRGFIQTIMSFIAWIGSIFVAVYLFPHLQPIVAESVSNEIVANSLTFIGTYIASLIVFIIIGFQLLMVAEAFRFGPIDRSLGLAFGIARGVVLVTVLFIGITFFLSLFGMHDDDMTASNQSNTPDWLAEAQTYNMLRISAGTALDMVPDDVFDHMTDFAKSFDNPMDKKTWSPPPVIVGAIRDMAGALPSDVRRDIFQKYQKTSKGAGGSAVDPQIQFEFSRDLVKAYFDQVREGKVAAKENISPAVVNKLEKIFDVVSPAAEKMMIEVKDAPVKTKNDAEKALDLEQLIKGFE